MLEAVASGSYHDPHSVLGAHPQSETGGRRTTVVRALRPLAKTVSVLLDGGIDVPLTHLADGIWEGEVDRPAGRVPDRGDLRRRAATG